MCVFGVNDNSCWTGMLSLDSQYQDVLYCTIMYCSEALVVILEEHFILVDNPSLYIYTLRGREIDMDSRFWHCSCDATIPRGGGCSPK